MKPVDTFAEIVRGWVDQSFDTSFRFVRHRRPDGEFEVSVRPPRGSEAGRLVIFTSRGDLWVRFAPPNMCYAVESRRELVSIVRQLVSERALFVVTYRRRKWTETTIVPRTSSLDLAHGETAHVVSWSGRFDRIVRMP